MHVQYPKSFFMILLVCLTLSIRCMAQEVNEIHANHYPTPTHQPHSTNCHKSHSTHTPSSTPLSVRRETYKCVSSDKRCFPRLITVAKDLQSEETGKSPSGHFLCPITAASTTFILLKYMEPIGGYEHPMLMYTSICFGVGLLFGVAAIVFWQLALFGLGFMAGFALAVFVWSFKSEFVITDTTARLFASISVGMLGGVGIVLVEFLTVILSTTFLGSYLVILGVDIIVNFGMVTGPCQVFNYSPFLDEKRSYGFDTEYIASDTIYEMLGGVFGLWLLGAFLGAKLNQGSRFGLQLKKNPILDLDIS
ncbi:hypothetical protein CLU79DRAFT_716004 [Phycomyces nitens]|nr:hypothetical protein CLU79DRAFT_716004 [Phycomyces nitens]